VTALGDDLIPKWAPFPLYALPPESFAGLSGGSVSHTSDQDGDRTTAIEYLYRPDVTIAEPMLGVTNSDPSDETSLLSTDPGWWAPGSMRIGEVTSVPFHLSGSVAGRTGARYLGADWAQIEGQAVPYQRWSTTSADPFGESLAVVRVRIGSAWVTLWGHGYTVEEIESIVPELHRVDEDSGLQARMKTAIAQWLAEYERRHPPGD
jgi:hypothetical protein